MLNVLICLLVVASVVTLVITIIIMKKLKRKSGKKSTALMYQNCGVHPESTVRDSSPFHVYVGISRDTSLSILFTHCCILYVYSV